MPEVAACGTYAAYNRHVRNNEPVDDACRLAANEYQRAWRVRAAERETRERLEMQARSRALSKLARLHPSEFAALQQLERRKLGLPR